MGQRRLLLSALGLLAMAACGGAASPSGIGTGTGPATADLPPTATLSATLSREIGAGKAVAIVPGPEGLRAISADGARQRTLAPGPVPWAIVDDRAQVVWFGSADRASILLIDLLGPATPHTETIVTDLPTGTDAGAPFTSVRYPGPKETPLAGELLPLGHPLYPHIVLIVDTEPDLDVDAPILEMWEQLEEFAAIVAKAKWPGRDRVVALARRGDGRSVFAPDAAPTPTGLRVPGVATDDCTDDPDACGGAEAITGTSLWRVVVGYTCGDGCYTTYRLYDPATKAFQTADWGTLLEDAWVARDGSAFVTGGRVVRFDTGPIAATAAIEADSAPVGGGWLGGGHYFGP
jgi:hypothetical protein